MIDVEAALAQAWAEVLAAPPRAACDRRRVRGRPRRRRTIVFAAAELGGNPVIPLVPMLKRARRPGRGRATSTAGRRARTSSTPRRCSSSRRCSDLVRDRLVTVRGVAADLGRAPTGRRR